MSQRLRRRNQPHSHGFSLLEVLIATLILSGGILVLANAWSGNFGRVRNARINNTMAMLLEQKMTELEIIAKEKSIDEIKEEDAGDFGAKFPGYSWRLKTKSLEMPNLAGALSARKEGVDEMTLMVVETIAKYIKDAVKEMSVTVVFKAKNGREIKHTATSYLVDYSKEVAMPGLPAGGVPMGGAGGQ